MNPQHQHQPLDMNQVIREAAGEVVDSRMANLIASALISAGNAQRNAGYAALGPVSDKNLLSKPTLLENNVSLLLVPFWRPTVDMLRLCVTHVEGKRVFTAYVENPDNLLETKFLTITDEFYAELDRQLTASGMTLEGNAVLGLIVGNQAVEGYEYFKAETAAEAGASTEAPAGGEATVETPAAPTTDTAAPKELAPAGTEQA